MSPFGLPSAGYPASARWHVFRSPVSSLQFPLPTPLARAAALASVLLAFAGTASAQLYWDNNGGTAGFGTAQGTWAAPTTNNSTQGWSASSAGTDVMSGTTNTTTTDALNFGTASAGLAAGTITVSGTVAANSLTFGSASGNIALSGGTITLGGTTPTITANNTNDTISSVLAGSAGLTKNGTGTLTLSGANTFTGNVVVNAGTIATSGSGTFADAVNVTVNSGGNYTVGVADTINTLSGSGVLRLNSGLTLANDSTFAGTISGSGALSVVLYKTYTFSGNNSGWSGSFNAFQGTFIAGSDYAFGTGTIVTPNGFIATFRSSNATDRYLANGLTRINSAGNSLTFGSAGTGNLTFAGGYGSSNGQNLQTTIQVDNAWTQFNGAFYSGGFLTKNGNGTLILNGNNTYGATTTINAGTLQIGASGRLGAGNYSSTIAINGLTSSFLYSGTSKQILGGVISGNGALTHNGTGTLTLTNNNTYTGATTINAGTLEIGAAGRLGAGSYAANISNNGTFIYSGTNAQTLSGVISGTGALTHNASSTLTLSGANTYNGATTINAGTLVISGTNTASAITINSGGSLLSATSLGSTTVNSGGKIAPGASANSVGSLTVAGLSLNSNGTYTWDMSNATGAAGTGWDRLVSSGLLTVGATSGSKFTIAIASSGTPSNWDYTSSGQTWDIITYGSLSGFSADKFAFDTSAFGGSVTPDSSWALSDTGSALRLTYTYAATTPTWNGASGNWSTGFSPAITSGANATFAGAGGTATNNILSGNLSSVGTILFSGTGAYTLQANSGSAGYDAASAMAIAGITNTSSGTQTIHLALSFASNQTISADSGMIVIGGPISGAGSLTKQGANALTLSGNNTYSGGTTLATGKLNINNASALGNGTLTITSGTLDSTVSGVTLNNNAQNWNGDFSFTGTNNLNLGTGAVTMNANRTITASAGTLTVGGVVSGTGFGITKNGSGTLALNGNNTFTGATTINAGTLQMGSSARLGGGSYSGNITINGLTSALIYSGTNNQTLSGAISGTGALTKDGSSTLTLSGASKTMSGAVTINNGTVLVSGGALNADFTVNSGATLIAGAQYALANGKTITLNGGTLAVGGLFIETGSSSVTGIVLNNGTINGNSSGHFLAQGWVANGNNTINNRVSLENNKAGSDNFDIQSGTTTINAAVYNYASRTLGITKNGVGALVLNAANSFGGTTTLNNGTIVLNNASALGTSALTIVSGTLDNTSNATITLANNNTQSWNGNFSFGGTRDLNMGTGAVAMNASRTITVNAGNFTVGGVISGSGFGLTKNGNGTLILTGASNYSGGTTLNAGTLVIGNTAAAGSGTITQSSASSLLKLDTTGTITNDMSVYNVLASQSATLSGAITVNNATWDIETGDTLTISGAVSGNGGVTKNGGGTLTFTGNNTYSGATAINSGTLVVNGSAANSAVTIGNGGILGGNGTVGALNVQSGGRVAPGNSPGNLNVSTLTLNGGGGYNWEITNVTGTAGTNWDLITVGGGTGAATISATSGNKFTIYISGNPTGWDTNTAYDWNIIDWGTVTGFDATAFAVDTTGFTGTAPIGTWSFSNSGGYLNLAYTVGDPTWNGGTGNWTTGFTPNLTGGNMSIYFAGNNTATATNNIASATVGSVASITFNSTAGAYTLAANSGSAGYDTASALELNGNIVNNSNATQTINLALTSNATRVYDAAAGNITIGGAISGTGGLTKNGSGTLALSGNNTYTGDTTINSGTLAITGSGKMGGGNYTGNISNAGTFNYASSANQTLSGIISGNGALTQSGASNLTLTGVETYTGATTITAGTLTIGGAGKLGSGNYSGNIANSGTFVYGSTANQTLGGTISGTGALIKNANSTLTLSHANTYNGSTTINAGTLSVSAASAMGATTQVILNTGGSLLIGASDSINDGAAVTLAGGKVEFTGNINETLGLLSMAADSIIDMAGGNIWLEFAGVAAVMDTFTLKVYNYTLYSDHIYFTSSAFLNNADTLSHIRFFSDNGTSFIGNSFIEGLSPYHVRPVPEPETYATAALLLLGLGIYAYRRRQVSTTA